MDISNFLAACEAAQDVNLTHFLCVSGDAILAEHAVKPYRLDTLRLCFSMTKSFSSLAVGIAWGRGLLKLDDKVSAILPECMPQGGNALKVRVRDLLTMSGGVHDNNYGTLVEADDWVRAYFAQDFPHEPGAFYLYCTHGSHVLSAIVERVSGLSLEHFLNRYLFHPMGIFEAQWEHAPEGRIAGGMGLSLYPASLAKIAQLLLNGGQYEGRQLIPEEYLKMAGAVQILKQDHKPEEVYGGNGYGFQFHVGKDGHYRMDGAFGQVCLICPELDRAYIALSAKSKTESLLRLIYTHFINENAVTTGLPMQAKRLSREAICSGIPSGCYSVAENPMNTRSVLLRRSAEKSELQLQFDDKAWSVTFQPGEETCGRTGFIKDLEEHEQEYVCVAAESSDMLELTVYYIETPYIAVYRLERTEEKLCLVFEINCSFTLKNSACQLTGADLPDLVPQKDKI